MSFSLRLARGYCRFYLFLNLNSLLSSWAWVHESRVEKAMASKYLSFSSSLLPSPTTSTPNQWKKNALDKPTKLGLVRSAFAAPSRSTSSSGTKKRIWKKGEYPGFSETSIPGARRNSPIKNIKKKLDRQNKAKAWACTVTETLSDHIDKKQWLQALQVFSPFRLQTG